MTINPLSVRPIGLLFSLALLVADHSDMSQVCTLMEYIFKKSDTSIWTADEKRRMIARLWTSITCVFQNKHDPANIQIHWIFQQHSEWSQQRNTWTCYVSEWHVRLYVYDCKRVSLCLRLVDVMFVLLGTCYESHQSRERYTWRYICACLYFAVWVTIQVRLRH